MPTLRNDRSGDVIHSPLSHDDLPDCCYRYWFDDGVRPRQAAARAVKAAGE